MTQHIFHHNDLVIRFGDSDDIFRLRLVDQTGNLIPETVTNPNNPNYFLLGQFWHERKQDWSEGFSGKQEDRLMEVVGMLSSSWSRRKAEDQVNAVLHLPAWISQELADWTLEERSTIVRAADGIYRRIAPLEYEQYEMRSGEFRQVVKDYGFQAMGEPLQGVEDASWTGTYNHLVGLYGPLSCVSNESIMDQPRAPDGRMLDAVVLDSFLDVGDHVIVYPRASEPLAEGREFVCVDFNTYHRDLDFGCITADRPRGYYHHRGSALFVPVDEPDAKPDTLNLHLAVFKIPKDLEVMRNSPEWKERLDGKWVAELPRTAFVIGDRVLSRHTYGGYGEICGVNYPEPGDTENPVTYSVDHYVPNQEEGDDQPPFVRRGSFPYVKESELQLSVRGNLWWHLYDRSKIGFADLKEELGFYVSLGEVQDVRHPRTNNYMSMTKDEALEMIRIGQACGLRVRGGWFGAGPSTHAFCIPNHPELEARVRARTLEGFELA